MNAKSTEELDALLENMKPEEVERFFLENRKELSAEKAFYYYIKDVLEEKNIRLKDVYAFAGFSETYGRKLITMEKHAKNRDYIVRLCIAGHFNLKEINHALKLYGYNELYARDPRDVCFIVAVNNRDFDLYHIDDILAEHGLERMMKDDTGRE